MSFTFEDLLCAFEKYNPTLKFHSPVTQNNRWEGREVWELGYICDHVLRGVAKYNCRAYFEMDILYRNPAKIFKTHESRCREPCLCNHDDGHRLLVVYMEIHKKDHRLCRKGNSKLPYRNSGKNSGREDYAVAYYYVLILFCFHNFDRLTTDLPSLHSGWLCKNSSALIYGADHIFHKLKMTTSRHVLMNKSHRFWVFPLKQKQKQTSPNYILSYILNCFKHMLIAQKPGSSSQFLSALSFPKWTHPCSTEADMGSPVEPRRLLEKQNASSPHHRAEGWERPEPRVTSFPGIGAHFVGAVHVFPGSGKTWMGWQQGTWMLSDCHHPSSSLCLGWAHSPIVFWSPPRKPEPT